VTPAGVEYHDGVPVVRPREDIDAANAAALRELLADCVDPSTHRLIVDLSETRYIDSAGIDMLFRLAELLRQRRTQLLLVISPESHLARLAEIVGLGRSMAIHASLQEALGAEAQPSS
jgi:stage II sporulation protein AA (anti-sigma F factor antagonist)